MSTSGQISYNLNANQIIDKAFHRLGKASEGEAMTSRMYEDGRSSLNLVLKAIGAEDHLWTRTESTVTLVSATAAYVLTPKPLRIFSVRRRLTANLTDTVLREMSRQEYFEQSNKTTSPSMPVGYYYDPQRETGTLYVWPSPISTVASTNTLQITHLRRLEDMIASNDDLDMPQEWLQGVIWLLANDLETEYPVTDSRLANKIEAQAGFWWAKAKAFDNETASIFLQPEYYPC